MTERLKSLLLQGIEFCNKENVFEPVTDQPPFATLIGLIIEQGRRFSMTRSIRRQFWLTMGGKRFTAQEFLEKADKWEIHEPDHRRVTLMKHVARLFSDGKTWINEKGIGPWTVNAHKIMCGKETDVYLEGDAHIRNSMKGITTWTWIKEHMPAHLTELTRFFWRLSSKGRLHLLNCIAHPSATLRFQKSVHFF